MIKRIIKAKTKFPEGEDEVFEGEDEVFELEDKDFLLIDALNNLSREIERLRVSR